MGIKWYPVFVGWSYYSQVITPIKTLQYSYKTGFYTKNYTVKFGLQDCSGFLPIMLQLDEDIILAAENIPYPFTLA